VKGMKAHPRKLALLAKKRNNWNHTRVWLSTVVIRYYL
jgi:hypothetical protein